LGPFTVTSVTATTLLYSGECQVAAWSRPGKDSSVHIPEIRYARNGDTAIAYQVMGDGPLDLVYVPWFGSNLLWHWQLPAYARFLKRLAAFSRLIMVDRRGTGLSDRFSPEDLPPLETLIEDLKVVLDAVGSERAALFGCEDGGLACSLFAATYAERTRALVLYAMGPGRVEVGWTDEGWDAYIARASREWGSRPFALYDLEETTPSLADDTEFQDWYSGCFSLGASAATAEALLRIYKDTNIQPVLGAIRVPTLVLQRPASEWEPIEMARQVASLIPGAKLVELPGSDFTLFVGDVDSLTDEIEEFLTGARHRSEVDRVLATVLFTDIVGSTERLAELGDAGWRSVLFHHDERARAGDRTSSGPLRRFHG
jgi:pimeloyl-ACP methyl ester carboxylesterase